MNKTRLYLYVWAVLVAFTLIEVGALFTPLTRTLVVLSIAALASIKAVLVASFYQHLKYEDNSLRIFPLTFLALTIIFILLTVGGAH